LNALKQITFWLIQQNHIPDTKADNKTAYQTSNASDNICS